MSISQRTHQARNYDRLTALEAKIEQIGTEIENKVEMKVDEAIENLIENEEQLQIASKNVCMKSLDTEQFSCRIRSKIVGNPHVYAQIQDFSRTDLTMTSRYYPEVAFEPLLYMNQALSRKHDPIPIRNVNIAQETWGLQLINQHITAKDNEYLSYANSQPLVN